MSAKGGGRRRGTFGGSRLSLTSLLFASAPKEKEKESLSRSANDLAEERKSARSLEEERMAEEAAEEEDSTEELECALCARLLPAATFPRLQTCAHRFCAACWRAYLETEIAESRVRLACADCPELLHPSDVYALLQDRPSLLAKWEAFALRRCLMSDPDTRFCPAPDCDFALIAAGCAACPELRCLAPGCGATFCYHCKGAWHPYETCDEARAARPPALIPADSSGGGGGGSLRSQDLKACPRCRTYIVKMNDGSCNHMICPICGAEFCWLCLKEISDLHYLSPSGCTFWGKKPWSRKKKLLWQLGTLIGAPLGITLIAGLAVPAIIVGVPVLVGRKVHQRVKKTGRWRSGKRRAAVAGSVAGTFLVSPLLATMAVGVGVPIMLAYVYGVVPLSLCRNGNCGVSASSSGVRLDLDEEAPPTAVTDPAPSAAQSSTGGPETRRLLQPSAAAATTSIHSGTSSSRHLHVCTRGRRPSAESGATASLTANFEEASTRAIYADDKSLHTVAGSIGEDEASTRALAGSVLDAKSLCGLSFTSVSIRSDSRPPASNTALVTVETHPNPLHSRSERGSPAPLLEEELSGAEEETEAETSSARRPPVEAVLAADEEEGEFLLLSADAYHQLHPDGPPPPPPQPAASKAPSVSLLLENSPGELWQLFSDSVRGRSGSSRPGRLGSQRTTGGSISSLGEAAAGGSAQC